jgi:hypothetical protein
MIQLGIMKESLVGISAHLLTLNGKVAATFTGVSIQYDIDASILPIGSAVN